MTNEATHTRAGAREARLRDDALRLPGPRSRFHHPAAMAKAEAFVLETWTNAGWTCERRPFRHERYAGLYDHGDFAPHNYTCLDGVNLVARKPGELEDTVVVGAHLDTVRDSPGADDNGSGIVALLEIARTLASVPLRYSVELVAFDMEEIGLAGSRAFVESAVTADRRTAAAIILECVGFVSRRRKSQTLPHGLHVMFPRRTARILASGRRADWTAVIHRTDSRRLADAIGVTLEATTHGGAIRLHDPLDIPGLGRLLTRAVPSLSNLARSDHHPFWDLGIPAVQLTDTANFRNPHYHQPSDRPETLDYGYLAAIVEATVAGVAHAAGIARLQS